MPYSHHNTMVKSHNILVKTEEHNKAAQLTFQTKKKKSCVCKCILVIFILSSLVASTIFLVHFLAQKLNLDQNYSKQIASKFVLPSFSSSRNSDPFYSTSKSDLNYQEKSIQSSSQKKTIQNNDYKPISKWIDQPYNKIKNSNNNKKKKNSSVSNLDSNDESNNSSPRFNFTNMQFWQYFKAENAHLHPNPVRKTDISNEETSEVRLTIPQYAILKGVKLTEFGNRMFKFLSVPYAKPPIGDLRFSEPIEYKPKSPDTVLDNTKYGPICPQFFDEILVKTVTPLTRNMSEDCLTLNVWTPQLPKSSNVNISIEKQPSPKSTNNLWTILTEDTLDFEEEETNTTKKSTKKARQFTTNENQLLPVMVWIHGGGFSMGSTALDEYDGSILSSFGHVVVVTINYRLGVFGFFNLNSPDATGNQGLKDQVLALKWVKKYIKHFNGDPNKITIFGQSAGGFAVGLHMISPNTKGLFRRAILQSGSPMVFHQFYSNTYNIAKRLVQYVDCEEKDELENNPQADNNSTEPSTNENNEEENEEESSEDENNEDNSGKGDEKIHSSIDEHNEMKISLEQDSLIEKNPTLLKRRKRENDNEEDDEDGEDEPDEKNSESTTIKTLLESDIGISTESSDSVLSTNAKTTTITPNISIINTTFTTNATTATSTTTTTTLENSLNNKSTGSLTNNSKTMHKEDDEDNNDDIEEDELEMGNKNETKSKSSSLATELSLNSTTSTIDTSAHISTAVPSKDKPFFATTTVSSTSSTNLLPNSSSTNKKQTTTEKPTKSSDDELKKANKILKCMQSKTMKQLIKAQKNAMQNSMFPFSPNKHDSILPKMPGEVIKQDASAMFFHNNVEQILLGVNKDEGSLYLHLTMPQLFPSENLTLNISRLSHLRAMLAFNLTNAFKVPRAQATIVANLLLSNGPEIDTTENLVKKYYQLIADLMFNCPTVMLADELIKLNYQNENEKGSFPKKKQVYFYRFNERPSVTNWGAWMGITHHEEVQFVFGMPLKYPLKYNTKDLIFSKRIMKTWAHFAKTGEMLPQLDLQWPEYNKQQQLMELSAFEAKLTEKLHEKNCNLFRIGFESFMKRRKRFIF